METEKYRQKPARLLNAKSIHPHPRRLRKHSGYLVGSTSPFGTRKKMPIYMEETILDLPKIFINGGKRGYLVGIEPKELMRVLNPSWSGWNLIDNLQPLLLTSSAILACPVFLAHPIPLKYCIILKRWQVNRIVCKSKKMELHAQSEGQIPLLTTGQSLTKSLLFHIPGDQTSE